MIAAWRTLRATYADSAFSGEGARLFGGRWNRVGTPVVYLAEHRSLAVLELLTQDPGATDLAGLLLASVAFDPSEVEHLEALPDDWDARPAPASTAALGTEWAESGRSLVLRVPSVVLPAESNYILNPRHPSAARLAYGAAAALSLDPRLAERPR